MLARLKGSRIAGAGLNFDGLNDAGVTPAPSSSLEACTGMTTRACEG